MQTVRIRKVDDANGDVVLSVSSETQIEQLMSLIYQKTDADTSRQKLYYGGKELVPLHTIADYKINNDDVIQLSVKETDEPETGDASDGSAVIVLAESSSGFYRVGDAVDVVFEKIGAWFEARITGIFVDRNRDAAEEEDKVFRVVMDRDEETAPLTVRFCDIRPRARCLYETSELQVGMTVFVNYNIKKPRQRGYWYDCKITRIDRYVVGDLVTRVQDECVRDCVIKFKKEIMKIESPTPLSLRTGETSESIPLRKLPLYCTKCRDVSYKDCKKCSCCICGKKIFIDKLIICDECECTYHLFCLVPPLEEVPLEPEWYCPDCRIDANEIIRPGESLKTVRISKNLRTEQAHLGVAFDVDVGHCWNSLAEIEEAGLHVSSGSNVQGGDDAGVCSILLIKEDHIARDSGYEFYYTVPTGRQVSEKRAISVELSNNLPNKLTKMLAISCSVSNGRENGFGKADCWKQGKPIGIIRSCRLRHVSRFCPEAGYRYDGTYKVVEYFPEIDSTNCVVWRFLMRRDDRRPPPWSRVNKKIKLENFHLDLRVENLINNDDGNKKIWENCKNSINDGKHRFLENVKELFSCVCCQDLVLMPVTVPCGHNFCHECLKRCFSAKNYYCPKCRFYLGKNYKLTINRNLEVALQLLFPEYEYDR